MMSGSGPVIASAELPSGTSREKSPVSTRSKTTRPRDRITRRDPREKYLRGDSPSTYSVSGARRGISFSSPRSLSHRHRNPVRGFNSGSCQPSPNPQIARSEDASNCSIAIGAGGAAATSTATYLERSYPTDGDPLKNRKGPGGTSTLRRADQ